ncbi:hypothetical protein M513_14084, partial [Trichuris suis]
MNISGNEKFSAASIGFLYWVTCNIYLGKCKIKYDMNAPNHATGDSEGFEPNVVP